MLHVAVQPAPIASVRHVRFAHFPRFASPPHTCTRACAAHTHHPLYPGYALPSGEYAIAAISAVLCVLAQSLAPQSGLPSRPAAHHGTPRTFSRCSARQGPLVGRTVAVWLTPISIDPADSRQGSRCRCRRAVGGERRAVCKYGVIHRGNHHAEHGSLTSTASRAVLPTPMCRWTTIARACSHHVRLDSAEASLSGSGDERPRQLR
jgi:hypothetical protein